MSPLLFLLVVDEVLKELNDKHTGLDVDGTNVTAIAYANDLLLVSEQPAVTQEML